MSDRYAPPEGTEAEHPGGPAGGDDRGGDPEVTLSEETPDVKVVDRRWWARKDSDSDGTRSDKPAYVEELETQLAHKDGLLSDYAARYKTAAKEFEDTRVRLRKEVAKDVDREKRRVLTSFLEIVDNLDRAIEASRETADDSSGVVSLLTGVEMVRQQFLLTLHSHGVERIEVGAARFDPNRHDAISVVPVTDPERDDMVIDVVKPGYQLGDEVLRPATVTVGKLARAPQ